MKCDAICKHVVAESGLVTNSLPREIAGEMLHRTDVAGGHQHHTRHCGRQHHSHDLDIGRVAAGMVHQPATKQESWNVLAETGKVPASLCLQHMEHATRTSRILTGHS